MVKMINHVVKAAHQATVNAVMVMHLLRVVIHANQQKLNQLLQENKYVTTRT
jgi:hypothetical protein